MKHILFSLFAFLLINAANSQTILLSVEGVKQGKFKGESMRQRAADKIEVTSYSMELTSPRDLATGQASGKRQYQPLYIQKPTGAASPQFFQAVATNEILPKVVIEFYKTNASGEEILYYTITLENATVSGYKQFTQATTTATGEKRSGQNENLLFDELKFTFRKISVESNAGKTSAMDDWSK